MPVELANETITGHFGFGSVVMPSFSERRFQNVFRLHQNRKHTHLELGDMLLLKLKAGVFQIPPV